MDLETLQAKRDEIEEQLKRAQAVVFRLQGALAILKELLEEQPKE